jgi:hypothetical protein
VTGSLISVYDSMHSAYTISGYLAVHLYYSVFQPVLELRVIAIYFIGICAVMPAKKSKQTSFLPAEANCFSPIAQLNQYDS